MKLQTAMPASLFGAVLGISGLANDWRAAHTLWKLPSWPGELLAAAAVTIWVACVVLYVAKWYWRRPDALNEVQHPIQCCFIALIPVSTMLIALAALPYHRPLAIALYVVGVLGASAFSVWRQGALLQGGRDLGTATAILYLPSVAANFVAAIGAGAFGWVAAAQAFFGVGLFSWLAIETVLLHRMLHAAPMAPPLRATFGVQLAPPAVGLVAFIAAAEVPAPLWASMLLGYGVLQVLLAIRLLPWLLEAGFTASFWSFTFGVTALSLGAERLAMRGHVLADGLAPCLFAIANIVVGAVAVRSIWLLFRGELLPVTPAVAK